MIISEAWSKVAVTSTQIPGFTYDPRAYEVFNGGLSGGASESQFKITPGSFRELPAGQGA